MTGAMARKPTRPNGRQLSLDRRTSYRFSIIARRQTRCLAQIRAQHRAVPATVEPLAGASAGDRVRVGFDVPQPAITPGQVVTLYEDDLVLGGGWIEQSGGAGSHSKR